MIRIDRGPAIWDDGVRDIRVVVEHQGRDAAGAYCRVSYACSDGTTGIDRVHPSQLRPVGIRFREHNLVQTWYDDGRGGGYTYGVVTSAGPSRMHITWESGLRQRRPQDCHHVHAVPRDRFELAVDALRRASVLPENWKGRG